MRLIHLSDLHLVRPGERLFGLDPTLRLDQALDHIRRHEAAADLLLISGDLTDRGEAEAYEALAERLARMPMPTLLLLGNHDARGPFRAVFDDAAVDEAGYVQSVRDAADGVTLVGLDTLTGDGAHGELDAARLAWLARVLAARPDRAVYLAMHHPPVPCGIPGMDAIGLADAAVFWEVVHAHPQVRHIFAGHIHRPFFARRGGVTVSTLPAPVHQVHLQFEAEDVVLGSHEPGAYGIARLGRDDFEVHIRSFTDTSPRFVFDDASSGAAASTALPPVPPPLDRLV